MNETKKGFQPWNLLLILVCVVCFCGGVYLLNTTINARFDAVDQAVMGGMTTTSKVIDRIEDKLVDLQASAKAMEAKIAAPVAPPPPQVASDDAAAPAAAAAPAPAPAPAPAKAE